LRREEKFRVKSSKYTKPSSLPQSIHTQSKQKKPRKERKEKLWVRMKNPLNR